eukprot:TRINITY_DN18372_c0_g1_i1.p1 TRINITY_DN18372_c0_g1~~TRINITY_DN18372_c0_g1_i1.p1  ORF type:complete len:153 (-),score=48.87 TRINITY_DN18372_c0_g1_i1:143-601(-)
MLIFSCMFFFFQAEDGIRDAQESRGLGDVYKRQEYGGGRDRTMSEEDFDAETQIECERMAMNKRVAEFKTQQQKELSLFIHHQAEEFQRFADDTRSHHRALRLPRISRENSEVPQDLSMSLPRSGMFYFDEEGDDDAPVSYTHLTLPTKRIV